MSDDKLEPVKIQDGPFRPQHGLQWAMCVPGVLLVSSLAVGAMLACGRENHDSVIPQRPPETEADFIDGEIPLFIWGKEDYQVSRNVVS